MQLGRGFASLGRKSGLRSLKKKVVAPTTPTLPAPNFQTINYNTQHTIGGRQYNVTSAENSYNIQRASNYNLTRFEVRNNDLRSGDPSDRERAELSGSPFAFTGSDEIWVAYSMLPVDLDAAWWTTLFQAFGISGNGNTVEGPVLKLEHNNNGTETEVNIAGNNSNSARVQLDLWKGTVLQENKIYNFVWKLSFDGVAGAATLWVNGVQKFAEVNLPMGFGDNPVTYFKYGIYRDVQTGDQPPCIVIFSDPEYAVGTNALLARVASPVPMPYYSETLALGAITGSVVYEPPAAPSGPNLVADPSFNTPSEWVLYGSGIGTTAVAGGEMDVSSTTSSWAFRIKHGDVAFPAGNYRMTITVANWVSGAFSPSGHASNLNVIATGNSQLGTTGFSGNGVHTWDITLPSAMHLGIRGRSGVGDFDVTDMSLTAI